MELTEEQIKFNDMCSKYFILVTGNFFKASAEEKKLNMTDYKVFMYCLSKTFSNENIITKDIAKYFELSQYTISKSLRKLKSIKALNNDFTATDKFLDTNILKRCEEDPKYLTEILKKSK